MRIGFLAADSHAECTVRGSDAGFILFSPGTAGEHECNHAIFHVSLGQSVACNYRVNEAEPRRWLCFVA